MSMLFPCLCTLTKLNETFTLKSNWRQIKMSKTGEKKNFLDQYGKYIAAVALSNKVPSKAELELVVELFKNDSHR